MSNEELIAKAKGHAEAFGRSGVLPKPLGEFSKVRLRDAAVVVFGSDPEADFVEVYLDKATEDFITAFYHPTSEARKK